MSYLFNNNWLITGKEINLEQAKDFVFSLKFKELDERLDQESKKVKKAIDLFNLLLTKELNSLALKYENIDYQRIKLLGEEEFQLLGIDAYGAFSPSHNHIILNAGDFYMKKFPSFFYKNILHEMIIFSSFREYKYNSLLKNFEIYQIGLTKLINSDLSGVNKGIIDLLVLRIFSKYKKAIQDILKFDLLKEIDRGMKELIFFYPQAMFLDILISNLEEYALEAGVINTLYLALRGIFTGEEKIIEILQDFYGKDIIVSINNFGTDPENDLRLLRKCINNLPALNVEKKINQLSIKFIADLQLSSNN